MVFAPIDNNIQRHIPPVGNIHAKSPLAYQATREAVKAFNSAD